jgi:hypothetical protein
MPSLRSPEMKQRYKDHIALHPTSAGCPLCTKPALKTFQYWKITVNDFPYDLIAKEHHMIMPLRHVIESELTAEETKEFNSIKKELLNSEYHYIIEATSKRKSIPEHFHLHIIIAE